LQPALQKRTQVQALQQGGASRSPSSSCCNKPCDKKDIRGGPTHHYFKVAGPDWKTFFIRFRNSNWYQCGCGFALAVIILYSFNPL
jgi:hypothetical protein